MLTTADKPQSEAARQAEMTRLYWNKVRGPTLTFLKGVAAFFLFHPPLAQGVYFIIRSLSLLLFLVPLFAGETSAADIWLTLSGSLLTLVIGATLCLAAYRRQGSPEILLLASGSAFGLTLLELILIFQDRMSAYYLVDVFVQIGLVAFWMYGRRAKEKNELQDAYDALSVAATPAAAVGAAPVAARVVLP